jgi:5,10-methylenetetrahydromethanopterin reductase
MDFGIFLATASDSWKFVKRAEELGFRSAWFFDTPMLNAEMFVAMGAAAMRTSRIRLGTGVLIPSNRIEPITASGLASLNALAPGRIDFGVGTGFTSRRSLGLSALTLARLEEYVLNVQALLRGETVDWRAEGNTHKIRFLNPEVGVVNIEDPIKLYVSAFGPKVRQLTARLGAGCISLAEDPASLPAMKAAWVEAGRDPADLYTIMIAGGAVLADGEAADSPRVKAQAGPSAAMIFHNEVEQESLGQGAGAGGASVGMPPQFQPQLDAYRKMYAAYSPADARYLTNHRGHLMFLKPGEAEQMTADIIRTFTFTGTRHELVDRIRNLKADGLKQFSVELRLGHEMEMLQDWADVFAMI